MEAVGALTLAKSRIAFVAFRRPATVIRAARQGGLYKLSTHGWIHWTPNLDDLTACDWEVGVDNDVIRQLATEQLEQMEREKATQEEKDRG